MSLNIQNSRIQHKFSTISGETPTIAPSTDHTDGTWTPTDLYVGEIMFNVVDDNAWFRSLNGIIPLTSGATYISTYLNLTGGTMLGPIYGPTISATTISGATIYSPNFNGTFIGDGSGLTGITSTTFTGGTVNGETIFTNNVDFCSASVSASTITGCGGELDIFGNINVIGAVSATTFHGDGSNLINLPYFSAVTLDNVLSEGSTSTDGEITLTNGDITLTNGVFYGDGSGLTNLPPSNIPTLDDVLQSGNTSTNGDILLTNGDIILGTGTFYGDGSGLTGITASGTSETLEEVLTNGNSTGANDIIVDEGQAINHGLSNDLGIVFTADNVFTDLKKTQIKGESNGGYGIVGVDNSLGIETIVRLQTRTSDGYGADIFMIQGDNNITMVTQDNIGEFAQFDITPGVMVVSNPSNINGRPGLEYDADYSATFNNRTLVDREYVDNKFLNGLTDTDGTRTDIVRANINDGTGIFSEAGGEGSKVEVSDANVIIQSQINGYTGTSVVDSELITNTTESGTPGVLGYTKIEDGLYLQSKQTTYTEDTGYGSDDKLRINEYIINKYIDQYSGTLDLFYEPFEQEDLMDYEVEVYMKNTDTYAPQRRYMVWKMKRSCVYDNYNTSYDISPVDIQKSDYGFDPAYDSWDITRSSSFIGTKWTMDWNFGNYADYSITIKLKVTYKKY
jgi:hypothetical protein